jgi:hypothetical protein
VWGREVFDAWTGKRVKLNDEGDAIVLASFAPDEQHVYVENASGLGRVFTLDGVEIARLPEVAGGRPSAGANASQLNVVWSADSRAVAVTRYAGGASRVDVVIEDRVQRAIPSSGMAGWANQQLKLAVTGENPAIYDFERGLSIPLERGGGYPSWSEDDRHVAVDIGGEVRGIAVLDAPTGEEVLRVYNASACFDIYWSGDLLLAGWDHAVDIASASIVSPPTTPSREGPWFTVTDGGVVRWEDQAGVYAEARVETTWAASFSWTRRDVDQWPPVLFLGLGGKDACLGGGPAPVVVTPPFSPDKVPTVTPTPDK